MALHKHIHSFEISNHVHESSNSGNFVHSVYVIHREKLLFNKEIVLFARKFIDLNIIRSENRPQLFISFILHLNAQHAHSPIPAASCDCPNAAN